MQFRILLLFFIISFPAFTQPLHSRYFISFRDKDNSRHFLDHPESFLSQKSIARRQKQNIPITYADLPVGATFLTALQSSGARLVCISKWLNGAVVETSD